MWLAFWHNAQASEPLFLAVVSFSKLHFYFLSLFFSINFFSPAIEKNIREAEERHRQNDRKSHSHLFDSIIGCTTTLGEKQDNLRGVLRKDMKDLTEKQNYMNKYLGKLLD